MGIENTLTNYLSVSINDIRSFTITLLFSIAIIVIGVFLGRLLNFGLKKLAQKLELSKTIRGSFIDLFLVIIRWSIYIIFINLALTQLEIPALTNFFSAILITIPALTGALILIVIGFSIAHYLKRIIANSEVKAPELFSQSVFYFLLYMFGVYSLKTALITFEIGLTNNVILIFTVAFFLTIAYKTAKKD